MIILYLHNKTVIKVPLKLFLYDLIKRRSTYNFLYEFLDILKYSKKEIDQYRLHKLKKLLIHAYENVPFYKDRFKQSGINIYEFNSLADLQTFPVLTRQDLQNNWESIISLKEKKNKLSRGSSSGSTGYPVTYYKDSQATSAGHAALYLGWSFCGWDFGLKGMHIWGNPSTVNNEWKRLSSKIKAKVFALHKFPAYQLTDGHMFDVLNDRIEKKSYNYLEGYTNAIFLFANYLGRKNKSLKRKLDFVLTTAENLQDFQRQTIEKNLGPVFDFYGCSEINGIAFQCKQCGDYHVIEPHVFVEFGKQVDEFGGREIYVTDLDNYAFPLIRYRNDDIAIPSDNTGHSCTIPFERINKISGRQSDILTFPDGGALSVPSFFGSMLLRKINGITQYQVEKIKDDTILINFVTTDDFKKNDLDIIKDALKEYLQNRIKFEIKFVNKIDVSANGKFKLLIDKTKNDQTDL